MSHSSYKILADALMVLHLAFVCFVVLGGLLVLRWRWIALAHLPCAAWGIFIEASHGVCPLTPLENDLRHWAGEAGYQGGFIEQYIQPILYPDGLTDSTQWLLAGAIVLINGICYGRAMTRRARPVTAAAGVDAPVPRDAVVKSDATPGDG